MLTVKDRAINPRYSPTSFIFTPNTPNPVPLPLQSLLVLNKQEADEDMVDKFNDVIQITCSNVLLSGGMFMVRFPYIFGALSLHLVHFPYSKVRFPHCRVRFPYAVFRLTQFT